MRIAIIGPAHPYKGGIAQQTTELAHRLQAAGHDVELMSWRAQWPFFYPGAQFVPANQPELPVFTHTRRALSWKNPASWLRVGRQLRGFDQIIFVWWVPSIQGPIYLGIIRALGRKRPLLTVICHNVLPHEPRLGDRRLAASFLRQMNQTIVHTPAQAELARGLGATSVTVADLPLAMPAIAAAKPTTAAHSELLFFGFVRRYKGVDILLQALAQIPDVRLTIAGEFWGGLDTYTSLIEELGLQARVTIHNGYLPANELAHQIAAAAAVVLPYKDGSASQHVAMAHAYGTPVIATTAGSLSTQVHNGVDGLLCEPDNVEALAQAIKHFYEPGVADTLRSGVPEVSVDAGWQNYVKSVTQQ